MEKRSENQIPIDLLFGECSCTRTRHDIPLMFRRHIPLARVVPLVNFGFLIYWIRMLPPSHTLDMFTFCANLIHFFFIGRAWDKNNTYWQLALDVLHAHPPCVRIRRRKNGMENHVDWVRLERVCALSWHMASIGVWSAAKRGRMCDADAVYYLVDAIKMNGCEAFN